MHASAQSADDITGRLRGHAARRPNGSHANRLGCLAGMGDQTSLTAALASSDPGRVTPGEGSAFGSGCRSGAGTPIAR
jgi:hypothetical protein